MPTMKTKRDEPIQKKLRMVDPPRKEQRRVIAAENLCQPPRIATVKMSSGTTRKNEPRNGTGWSGRRPPEERSSTSGSECRWGPGSPLFWLVRGYAILDN